MAVSAAFAPRFIRSRPIIWLLQVRKHPHVIQILDVVWDCIIPSEGGEGDEVVMIAMEVAEYDAVLYYMMGGAGQFSERMAATYFGQLASGSSRVCDLLDFEVTDCLAWLPCCGPQHSHRVLPQEWRVPPRLEAGQPVAGLSVHFEGGRLWVRCDDGRPGHDTLRHAVVPPTGGSRRRCSVLPRSS